MPLVAITSPAEWLQGSLRGGAHPNTDGSLSLALKDMLGGFATPETDGIPSGWSMPLPSDVSGHAIMVGQVDEGQDSVTRQNTTPHPLSASHWVGSRPVVRGQRPVNKLYQVSLPRPSKPIVESVPVEDAGFPAGTPKVAYTEIAGDGLETQLSGYSEVTVSEGQGINLTLPSELSADRVGIGIYVSYGGTGAFRKVRNLSASFLDSGARSYTLTEYRQGAKPPSENRTQLGQGKQPGRLRFQRGRFALAPRVYRHTYTRVTRFGESLAAPFSVRRNILERHPNRALWIPPISRSKGSVGLQIYVEMDDEVFKVIDRGSNTPYLSYATLINRGVDIYGVSSDDSRGGAQGTRARPETNPRFILVQQDLPEEDTSGLEGPGADAELELEARGQTIPEPGRRFYQTAYLSDQGQGPPSPFTRHDTPTGSMPRISLSHPVNILKNAEFSELKANGTPVAWYLRGTGTDDYEVSDGVLSLFTLTPASTTRYWESAAFGVNATADQTLRGFVETSIVSGSAQVLLYTYDTSGAKINETVVAELASSGGVKAKRVFGPSGTAIPANAAEGTYVIRMSGSTRNMKIDVSHMAVHPFEGAPRKAANLYVDNEDADYNPPPETPYPINGHTGFGLPPAVQESAASDEAVRTDFEAEDYTASDGSAWERIVSGDVFNEITDYAAVSGSYGLYVGKAGGAVGNASCIAKPVTGTSAARRQKVYVDSGVGGTGNFVTVARYRRSDNAVFAQLSLSSSGLLELRYDDRASNRTVKAVGRVYEGETADMELVVSGADSASGAVSVLLGKNGNTRSLVYSQSGIDWRGVRPSEYRAGVSGVSNELAAFRFYIDDIAETERGDSITDAASEPPEGVEPAPPDRPQNADGTYRDTDNEGNAIRQFYAFVLAGEERYAPTSERYDVLPEETYYPAIFARSGSEECEPWRVVCYTTSGEEVDVGSLWSAGASQPWADRSMELVIPADCVQLQFVGQRLAPGEYVAQEPALSWRALDRSAGYVEDSGGFTVTLPAGTPGLTNTMPSRTLAEYDASLAYEGEVSARYRTTDDLLTYSEYVPSGENLAGAYAQIDAELALDADSEAPLVPSAGAALITRVAYPALLRADRSELSGGVWVSGLMEAINRAEYEVESVGGRTIATPTTPRVMRLSGFTLLMFTGSAQKELADYCLDREWVIESPLHGGTGQLFTIRFVEPLEFEEISNPRREFDVDGTPVRNVAATAEVEAADVLEIAPL